MLQNILKVCEILTIIVVPVGALLGIIASVIPATRKMLKKLGYHISGGKRDEENQNAIMKEIQKLSDKVDDNEQDRLRTVIMTYDHSVRNGEEFDEYDYNLLNRVYKRYTDLGGNDLAHDAYNRIVDYYIKKCQKNNQK